MAAQAARPRRPRSRGPQPCTVLAHGPLPESVAGQPGGGGDPDDAPAAQAGRPGWSAVVRPRPLEEEAHACGAQAGALVCSTAGGLPLPGGRDAGAAQDGLGDCSPAGQRPHAAEDAADGAAAGEGLGGLLAYLDSLEAPHACPATVRGPAMALLAPASSRLEALLRLAAVTCNLLGNGVS